jgi:ferredoxin
MLTFCCISRSIGGHRYAATCFTSTGDWYGLLTPGDAANFLEHLSTPPNTTKPLAHIWWEKWRGRNGLTKEAQIQLAEDGFQQQHLNINALEAAKGIQKMKKKRTAPLGDPVDIVFHRNDGEAVPVRAFKGETLMDCAKRYDLVEATCGGACECATCHVFLIPSDEDGPPPPVPETTDEEEDQLEYAIDATDDSRLACQVTITDELVEWFKKGGTIKLPRY